MIHELRKKLKLIEISANPSHLTRTAGFSRRPLVMLAKKSVGATERTCKAGIFKVEGSIRCYTREQALFSAGLCTGD